MFIQLCCACALLHTTSLIYHIPLTPGSHTSIFPFSLSQFQDTNEQNTTYTRFLCSYDEVVDVKKGISNLPALTAELESTFET